MVYPEASLLFKGSLMLAQAEGERFRDLGEEESPDSNV